MTEAQVTERNRRQALAVEFERLTNEGKQAEVAGASWCGDQVRGFAFLNRDDIVAALAEWAQQNDTCEAQANEITRLREG